MSKAAIGPTWALLSPNKLPHANEIPYILGAIVPDYENLGQNPIPEKASETLDKAWFAEETEDGNFKAALERASCDQATFRLGEILDAAFRRNTSNTLHLTSTTVKTYALRHEVKAFAKLKKDFHDDICQAIAGAPPRNKGSVFLVVAVKTCSDAELSAQDSKDKSTKVDSKIPIKEIAVATTGAPLPLLDVDPHLGAESTMKEMNDVSHMAKGERIFAAQYRIIKRESQWLKIGKPKPPKNYYLNDYLVINGHSMYAGDEDEDEDENELFDKDEDDDPIKLGSIEHTWNLLGSEADEIVMTEM